MIGPEHALQVAIKRWVRENVLRPHVWLAFDRTRKTSAMQHIAEANRGLRAGTPDTVLMIDGAAVWVELKAGRNTTSEQQDELHKEMAGVGFTVGVCWSVEQYAYELHARHIALRAGAFDRAQAADAKLAAPKVAKKGRKGRAPKAKPEPSKLAAMARLRRAGVFV